jgi:Ser/Thr protein kinase RdoA (MazF antagonist)
MKFEFKDSFNPEILAKGLSCYGTDPSQAKELGAYENIVWEANGVIYRFTHHTHRSMEWIEAELEFMDYLFQNGTRCVQPVRDSGGQFVTDLGEFYITAFAKAQGSRPTRENWVPAMWKNWGRQIGRMHRLAKDFNPIHKRYVWHENAYYAKPVTDFPECQQVLPLLEKTIEDAKNIPKTRDNWGLIHSDAHQGNFFVTDDLDVVVFDFDDSMYMQYAQDIAMVMFYGLLVPAQDRTAYARNLYDAVMDGYSTENTLSKDDLKTIPLFIDLRRLVDIFVTLAPKPRNLEDRNVQLGLKFVGDVVRGEPYIDIEFA